MKRMEVNSGVLVREVVTRHPRASVVFETLQVDYCDGSGRTLADAATAAGIAANELLDLLDSSSASPSTLTDRDWNTASLTEVTFHIAREIHPRARRRLVDLMIRGSQVASAHAAENPDLWAIKDLVARIARALVPHMTREEKYLFPYIESMERPVGGNRELVVPLFGTVEYPLQHLRHDHSEDLATVSAMRSASRDFKPPAGSCDAVTQFYSILEQFDAELRDHIRLEDNVLFPRAVDLEKKQARG
jgi:regulator of cell morphogenesis and NO signaling